MEKLVKIKKALISVSDKTDLKKILEVLKKYKIKIISSGGTYNKIKKLGYKCKEISEYTGFKEMLNGRVKTLHPKIHAGILSIRGNKKHKNDLLKNNFDEIDLVVVNFYPFEKISNKEKKFKHIIENIDIGGPALVRAAAKNFKDVVVIANPNIYSDFFYEIKRNRGSTTQSFRKKLASHAFNEISYYDSVISNFFNNETQNFFPQKKTFSAILNEKLRYGENPHQKAAFYTLSSESLFGQLHGKKLSFNNYNDIFSALNISKSFKNSNGTVIIKHANPCGVSLEKSKYESFRLALSCDPISAYGGILSCNYKIDKKLAKKINQFFFEIVIANSFDKDALNILKNKKNIRLIDANKFNNETKEDLKFQKNSFLLQEADQKIIKRGNLTVVSKKKPTKEQMDSLIFSLNVCKNVKSNAIVIAKNKSTIGIGSGQPSRLDSCKIAIDKARKFLPNNIIGSVAASDAFFPFTDGIEKLIQAGVDAIIQPSGSIRDKEIIRFANETETILVFSKTRHFKH